MKKNNLLILIAMTSLLVTACETALEKDLTGKKVILLSPVNNHSASDTMQTFYWERMDGATDYQLQVVSPEFDSITRLIEDTIITNNRFTIDLDTGNYQWRVKASNNSSSSDYSTERNLHIQ